MARTMIRSSGGVEESERLFIADFDPAVGRKIVDPSSLDACKPRRFSFLFFFFFFAYLTEMKEENSFVFLSFARRPIDQFHLARFLERRKSVEDRTEKRESVAVCSGSRLGISLELGIWEPLYLYTYYAG